jgi:hypothetical protein
MDLTQVEFSTVMDVGKKPNKQKKQVAPNCAVSAG